MRPESGAASVAFFDLGSERRGEFLDLMREIYGKSMSDAEFDWFFERNPVGSRLLSAADEDGHLLGVLAMSPARALVDGKEAVVAFAVHAVTHPAARGKGIFSRLELRNEARAAAEGASLALGFTNPMAGPILVGKLGWRDLYRMRMWARPLAGLRRGAVAGVEALDRFADRHEVSWRAVAAGWPACIVRDVAHLNWRYADAPKPYRLFEASSGYAVVGEAERGGVRTAAVCDLVGPPRVARRLLRACLRAAPRGARAAIGVPAPDQRVVYASLGFVPTPLTIRVIGKPLAAGAPLPERWHFTPGDTDIF